MEAVDYTRRDAGCSALGRRRGGPRGGSWRHRESSIDSTCGIIKERGRPGVWIALGNRIRKKKGFPSLRVCCIITFGNHRLFFSCIIGIAFRQNIFNGASRRTMPSSRGQSSSSSIPRSSERYSAAPLGSSSSQHV